MAAWSAWWLAALLTGQPEGRSQGFVEIGRVADTRLGEPSALEASRRYPGVYWTVGDSGNPPHLVAINREGRVLAVYRVTDAVNADWECLALSDSGRLYIGDVGNNPIWGKSRIPRRWVYVVREPDPYSASSGDHPHAMRPLPVERMIYLKYPAGPFDIEAAFACGEEVYFISKTLSDEGVYRLPLPSPEEAHEPESAVTLEKVAELPGLRQATSASLSPDGRRLAIATYRDVWLYDVAPGPTFRLQRPHPNIRLSFRAPAVEACAWEGRHLLLLNELGVIYHLRTD